MTSDSLDPVATFAAENKKRIDGYGNAPDLLAASAQWRDLAFKHMYMYHFAWLGRPIIQLPVDIVAIQELIWAVKPDLVIETGIAHGGSLVLSASVLAMLDYADAVRRNEALDPSRPKRMAVGIDIDIRTHNRAALDAHFLRDRIITIEGSSIAPDTIRRVRDQANGAERTMVLLDSNHTHDHVLAELNAYAPMASVDSYCVVFDTVVQDLPNEFLANRPWGRDNSPKTAVWEFLKSHPEFAIDRAVENKLLTSAAPDGYLRRLR